MAHAEQLRLLPKEDLFVTGPVDCAHWVHTWHLGWLMRSRLQLIADLLPHRVNRLLEVGYGSGIFMPELDTRANQLFGIDPHTHPAEVAKRLRLHGVHAQLVSGTAEQMPYETGFFDRLVAISALEFIPDLDAACNEMIRVLAPDGRLVVVTPGESPLLDWGLKVLTGRKAQDDFGDRRSRIIPTLMRYFHIERKLKFPKLINFAVCAYQAFELSPRVPYRAALSIVEKKDEQPPAAIHDSSPEVTAASA